MQAGNFKDADGCRTHLRIQRMFEDPGRVDDRHQKAGHRPHQQRGMAVDKMVAVAINLIVAVGHMGERAVRDRIRVSERAVRTMNWFLGAQEPPCLAAGAFPTHR